MEKSKEPKSSLASVDLNARKNELAERLAEIAEALREKDANAKRDELMGRLQDVTHKIRLLESSGQETVAARLDEVESYIKQHPVTAVAIALGAGLFLGSLFKKN